jgi:hypothetical protein
MKGVREGVFALAFVLLLICLAALAIKPLLPYLFAIGFLALIYGVVFRRT